MVSRWLEGQWGRVTGWQLILLPVSGLFALLSGLRRMLYQAGVLRRVRMTVPVVVVGNIGVGGTGKTPVVLWLVERLREAGFRPGVVSRGYGGTAVGPLAVDENDDPARVGDEPVLLAARAGCPIVVGRDRVAAARALLATHPECDVLVSDDGLQHYRLARDVEIVVVDGQRRFGNGFLLPAGPLRERLGRLARADAILFNGGALPGRWEREYAMTLIGTEFRNVADPARCATAEDFRGKGLHAVAGIGNPQRFFDYLRHLGLNVQAHPFPDHYAYRAEDLRFADADAILMTEKDAVKCRRFATDRFWSLGVDARLDPALAPRIIALLRKTHGSETA